MHLDMETISPSQAPYYEISKHLKFLEVLKQHDNVLSNEWYKEWHSYLSVCHPILENGICPTIASVGLKSSQAELFGEDWARSIYRIGLTPDEHLDTNPLVVNGYTQARKYGISDIERHFAIVETVAGKRLLSYTRTVADLKTRTGESLFVYLGTHQFLHLQ